jgi:archaellum component FlaC
MKKNYEDLQKEIDKLNLLLGSVKDQAKTLKDKYRDNDIDLEMDNDFKHKVDDVLNDCDRDINGDKAERAATPD